MSFLENAQKNDQQALRALTEWITERNRCCSDKCPMDILHTEDAESLAKWLSLLTIELATRASTVLDYMSDLAWNNIGKPVKPLLTLVTSK